MKCLLILLLSTAFAWAQPVRTLQFLHATDVRLDNFPAPPGVGSLRDKWDLAEVLFVQRVRTEDQCRRARSESHGSLQSFFGKPYGPLTQAQVLKYNLFFNALFDETDVFVRELKGRWQRPRPYLRDARIQPCISLHGSSSYPSGHAAIARSIARVFAQIFPRKAHLLMARGDQIGWDRVVGGVHHPVDIRRGRELGDLVYRALRKSPRFQAELRFLRTH